MSTTDTRPHCDNCQQSSGGFFCLLEKEGLEFINSAKRHDSYAKGAVIFERGDSPSGLFCVLKGVVKVETENEEGKSHILRIVGPGNALGYRALFSQSNYQARAVAHEKCEICFIPRPAIEKLVQLHPELSLKFLALLSEDVKRAEERLCSATDKATASRVADTILFLDSHYSPEKPWTRKEIADWAGTTPETVMRTLTQFEDESLIRSRGKFIEIADRKKLLAISRS
jgi:CRP-like cAMP-binding protein